MLIGRTVLKRRYDYRWFCNHRLQICHCKLFELFDFPHDTLEIEIRAHDEPGLDRVKIDTYRNTYGCYRIRFDGKEFSVMMEVRDRIIKLLEGRDAIYIELKY